MLVKKSHFPRKIPDYTEKNFIVCNYELEKTVYLFVTLGNTTNLKGKKRKEKKYIALYLSALIYGSMELG
jgi:hypothetical protein